MNVRQVVLGRRLANREFQQRKIGAFDGLAAMGLDGLGSSAYGPEAALTILMPLGAASLSYIGWVMAPIVALLAILSASYWQTIRAYPSNGGAYAVARENLGANFSLLAAAALMIDYVLNVAVGISAGVGALVSAIPALHPHTLALCLGILLVITVVNLRGTSDASRIFAFPTYLFIASFAAILLVGLYKSVLSGGHPAPIVAPPALPQTASAASLWLLLRSFASGCTAMTGVEAVSNGMSAFREPAVKYGHRTLLAIVTILGLLLAGIAYLASAYGIGAMDQAQPNYRSVLSQLASASIGEGTLYYIAIGSVLCVLAFSANTSFVAFPRLCRSIAQDGFLPKPFAVAGQRLVFSIGILYLTAMAGLLLIAFDGITDRLIPLFAIGAFITFTLSQTAMVVHWRRALRDRRSHSTRLHLSVNAVGAATTGVALLVIVVAKFREGAWITILAIPCVIALLKIIRAYYDDLAARVRDPTPLDLSHVAQPIVVVAIENWNKLADRAITFALSLSSDVVCVHLAQLAGPEDEERHRTLHEQWSLDVVEPARAAGYKPPRLVTLQAQYRTIHQPILRLANELQTQLPGRPIAVLIPELVKDRWYQHLLHTHRGLRLRSQLLKHGGPQLTVINVPWHLNAERKDKL